MKLTHKMYSVNVSKASKRKNEEQLLQNIQKREKILSIGIYALIIIITIAIMLIVFNVLLKI